MDRLSRKILEEYAQRKTMDLNQLSAVLKIDWDVLFEPVCHLKESGFIRVEQNYAGIQKIKPTDPIYASTPLEIGYPGLVALEEAQTLTREKRNELIRYIITTAIAVAAFLKSFFFLS